MLLDPYILVVKGLALLGIPPSQDAADAAARNGRLDMVKYLVSINIRPTEHGAGWAASEGYLEIVKFLAALTPPILPDQAGVGWTAMNGELDTLKYLVEELNLPPTQAGVNLTAQSGSLNTLVYLASLTPPILPEQYGATLALRAGHHDVVQYLATWGIFPTLDAVEVITIEPNLIRSS